MEDVVRTWVEKLVIPTYKIGTPDRNPMFLEKRVYQGSSGVVYPHPVIDRVSDEKYDREYTAIFLENQYLKIMVLPELGGRVQMALDKTNGYHWIYYNRVIKPALVGLTGPWISGGIEFNWPQHHRPSTFSPVDWTLKENGDGSKTVWCSELEVMFNTRGTHALTLYPGRAYLEVRVQLSNRTPVPQSFLWWANPAVHVNDQYQSIFPPDVHAVMDHGKRDVSDFPIATGTYYKVNYAPGTDISRYKNIPVPTSFMAYHSDYDFLGDYDYGAQAGMLHVANHHIVPGKKQWTWGCGDFGRAWDRQLTDSDGPYVELMCGAYTDNQPDFSWIQPGETKRFTQVFMPYQRIGPASNASREAAVSLRFSDGFAHLGVYVAQARRVRVQLLRGSTALIDRLVDLAPERPHIESIQLKPAAVPQEFTAAVFDNGRQLVSYTPRPDEQSQVPAPATAARPPSEITSNEELYLNGLHLEQYRHATYAPEPYYLEALARDPLDSRCNNALGLLLLRRGKFAEGEEFFRKAIQRLTIRNPNPYDGEPYYNLGLALKLQERWGEALDAFYKATWNAAWAGAAFFELARLACRDGRLEQAYDLAGRALAHNGQHQQAEHLRIALLRRLGRTSEAQAKVDQVLRDDPAEYGAQWEKFLLDGDSSFEQLAGGRANAYIEISLDYAHAGLYLEALGLLERAPQDDPMVRYFSGWYHLLSGNTASAQEEFRAAASLSRDYSFPNKLEAVPALEAAVRMNPQDAQAYYLLGNFWYAHRRHTEAISAWETARELDADFPTVHRNLGLAYYNELRDPRRALASYERAFACDPRDARVLYELDQLMKKMNRPPVERLARLEAHLDLVEQRDDLILEQVTLLNLLGRPEDAYRRLMSHTFHPWEGGEGKVTGQYVLSLVEWAKRLMREGDYATARLWLERAQVYPENLGEGKLYGARENHILYYLGCAYEGLGDFRSREYLERACAGSSEPASAIYYNDQPPDLIFYQGLAHRRLGHHDQAASIFSRLVEYGQSHLHDQVKMDYFAVSLPDFLVFDVDLERQNRVHCHYMMGLGYLGLGDNESAQSHLEAVLDEDASHLGASIHHRMLEQGIPCD